MPPSCRRLMIRRLPPAAVGNFQNSLLFLLYADLAVCETHEGASPENHENVMGIGRAVHAILLIS